MKKIPIFNLITLFLLGLIFPAQGVFVYATGPSALPAPAVNTAQALVVPIQVVFAPAKAQVAVVQGPQYNSSLVCQGPIRGVDLLQGASLINLNQPANCFSFQAAYLPPPLPKLSVIYMSANKSPKVVVQPTQAKISSPDFFPAPFTQQSPVLPLAAATLGITFFVWDRRLLGKVLQSVKSFKIVVSAQQLQVLRC